jgi:hypothetical protein
MINATYMAKESHARRSFRQGAQSTPQGFSCASITVHHPLHRGMLQARHRSATATVLASVETADHVLRAAVSGDALPRS